MGKRVVAICSRFVLDQGYDEMLVMFIFQDRSVSEIETSFSEHFVAMENQSDESSDEFPSSDFHILPQLDSHKPSHQPQPFKFEENLSRPTSNCSTIINSAPTATQISSPETPVNAISSMQQPQSDRGEGE